MDICSDLTQVHVLLHVYSYVHATIHVLYVKIHTNLHMHTCIFMKQLLSGVDNLYRVYTYISICNITRNRNVFTNFLPCSRSINPNNEPCLVTCTDSQHTSLTLMKC